MPADHQQAAQAFRVTIEATVWDMTEKAAEHAAQKALDKTKRLVQPIVKQVAVDKMKRKAKSDNGR